MQIETEELLITGRRTGSNDIDANGDKLNTSKNNY